MSDKEMFELVWENGQLFMRDLPRRDQKSPSCNGHSSHDSLTNAHVHVKNGGDTFPQKRARFGTLDSVVGDSHHDKKGFFLDFTPNNPLQDDNLPESWPEMYQTTPFDVFLEHNKCDNYDLFQKDSQVVPVHEHANLKTGCTSNYFVETPQLAPTSQPDHSSLKQYQESIPFQRRSVNSRQNLVSIGELPDSKLLEQDLESEKERTTTNVSLFLRSPALLKINSQRSGDKMPTSGAAGLSRAEELKNNDKRSSRGRNNSLESMPIAPGNGSRTVKDFHYQPNSVEANVELLPWNCKPPDKSLPDDQSEADCRADSSANKRSPNQVYGQTSNLAANKVKGKLNTQKSIELPVASTSLCSRGASNNPIYNLKRRSEDTAGSDDHPSQNIEKKPKSVTKVVPGRKRNRKKRTAEVHNLSERRRRDKINKKLRALQELIPNCNKVDKASMLDEAIDYLKALQLQVQMMSMQTRVCMPQMMLPTAMQQLHSPQMTHCSPIGIGMAMRMHMGIGYNPAQFLISPIPGATALPGPGMPGFLGQLPPMPVFPAPLGLGLMNSNVRVPGVSLASAPTELMGSATVSNSVQNNINSEKRNNTNAECSKIRSFF